GGNDRLNGYKGNDLLYGLGGNDTLKGKQGNDILEGGAGRDKLYGGDGEDKLIGGEGDDTLYGNEKDDILAGGPGKDVLKGGSGSDTYLFGRGDGEDVITDKDSAGKYKDVVVFGEDIAAEQLWFSRHGRDLEVQVIGSEDRLAVSKWYDGGERHMDAFHLTDGQVLLEAQVHQLVDAMAAFDPSASGDLDLSPQPEELAPVIAASWQ
ncbi:MAG: calcium-binding protein, partial [bacterium]|nr:calcium-binding protein [bacterium]